MTRATESDSSDELAPTYFHSLETLPVGATKQSVTAAAGVAAGRSGLRVELTDAITADGLPGVDYVDMPTFVVLPTGFRNGMIRVDVLARLNGKTDFDARGFAGIAFGISEDLTAFESIYLRVLNGLKMAPQPPRDRRAVQYFAYPDWPFSALRDAYPDGRYESAADIAAGEWITMTVTVTDNSVTVGVDDATILIVRERKAGPRSGSVGLFVDIGSEAYFRQLTIESHDPR